MHRHLLLKVWLILSFSLLLLLNGTAQEYWDYEERYEDILPDHELKVDVSSILFSERTKISYEYLIDTKLSIGGSFGTSFESRINRYIPKYQFMPYFRWNFDRAFRAGERVNRGHFYEINTNISLFSRENSEIQPNLQTIETLPMVGIGVGWGYKYITRSRWVFEVSTVWGRYFTHPEIKKRYHGVSLLIGRCF